MSLQNQFLIGIYRLALLAISVAINFGMTTCSTRLMLEANIWIRSFGILTKEISPR